MTIPVLTATSSPSENPPVNRNNTEQETDIMTNMTTPSPVFRIVRTGQGMGGFLAPPGHPEHFYEVRGYWPRGDRAVTVSLRREADSYGSLSNAIENERDQYPAHVVAQAQRIMDRAELACSEAWVRSVYGYFRNSYSPDGADRNASNAVSASGYRCACGEHSYNRRIMQLHFNQAIKAMLGLRKRWTRKPITVAPGPHHLMTLELPAEHHLGYLCVRSYFPEHTPRLDLIADPGQGYGSYPCVKCGKPVQYEARVNGFAEAEPSARNGLNYVTDCPSGGKHER
jgi:hypothetical protein